MIYELSLARTTVVLSDLLSRTYAGVEPIDLSRTYLRQTSHHLCAYFKINRFDELSSTKIRRCPGLTFCLALRSTRDKTVDNFFFNFRYARNES